MSKVLNAFDNNTVHLRDGEGSRKTFKLGVYGENLLTNNGQLILAMHPNETNDAVMMVTEPEKSSQHLQRTEKNVKVGCILTQCSNVIQIIPTPLYSTTLTPHVVYSTQFSPQIATAVQTNNELPESQIPTAQPVVNVITSQQKYESPSNETSDIIINEKTGGSNRLQMLSDCARAQAEEFVTQLSSIVSSPIVHSAQEALDPKEVMKFYNMLPEEKKVFKARRTKYRKYSLATEFQMFQRAEKIGEQESVSSLS